MYVKIESFWDAVSASILLCNYILIYESFNGYIELPLGVVITLLLEKLGKKITGKWYPPIFKRPDDARDCSLFNQGGPVGNNPGFPSGHVAMASYFSYVFLFKYFDTTYTNIAIASFYPILMSLSRYYRKCHNVYQVIAGFLLGLGVALLIKYVANYDKKKIKNKIN